MDKKKTALTAALFAVLAALTSCAMFIGVSYHAKALGRADLKEDMLKLDANNKTLEQRRDRLASELASKTDSTGEKDELNKKIITIKEDMDSADLKIADIQTKISKLNTQISTIRDRVNKLNGGINRKNGRTVSVTDKTLMCPIDLDEGRYIASGSGAITVTALTNSVRIAEDLSRTETNSYTFDIETGESVTVRGTVTITKLI